MIEKLEKSTTYYKICRTAVIPLNEQMNTGRDLPGNEVQHGSAKMRKEEAFEEYRLKNCPNIPSRKSCLFICTEDQVGIWIKKLTHFVLPFTIVKLELTGEVFWANVYNFDENNPVKYWEGCESNDKDAFKEGLFIGDFKAIENCTDKFKVYQHL